MSDTFVTTLDCSPPGVSIHRILQARIPEWVAIFFSGGSSRPRVQIRRADSLLLSHLGNPSYSKGLL